MKEYLERIIIPYVGQKRGELKLAPDHLALEVFDIFKLVLLKASAVAVAIANNPQSEAPSCLCNTSICTLMGCDNP